MITTMTLAVSFSSSSSAKVVSVSSFPRSISSSEHKVSQIGAFRLLNQSHVAPTAVCLSQRRSSVKPVNANGESKSNGQPASVLQIGAFRLLNQPHVAPTAVRLSQRHSFVKPVNCNDHDRVIELEKEVKKIGQQIGRRIELPIFVGEDPDGWVYRIERYFRLYRLSKWEKLDVVALAMEGEALAWYRWEQGRQPWHIWTSWEVVKKLLLKRFRPTKGGTLLEQFLAIRQESTVREYRQLFELYAAPLEKKEITEEVLKSHFVNGLKPDIREELRLMEPKKLEDVMEMAQRIEDKNIALRIRTSNGRIIP